MTVLAIIFAAAMFVFGMWGEFRENRKLRSMAKDVEERHDGSN